MIISLIKEETSVEYNKRMEKKYKSIEQLEKIFEKTPKNLLHVDLVNWRFLKENPEEKIKFEEILITDNVSIGENEIKLLNFIKNEKPKSVREIALKIEKDPANVNNKINQLANEGLISFKKGLKNSKIPYLNYDKIEIAI
jgi:DNA-binding MarR family transcriptional regulator